MIIKAFFKSCWLMVKTVWQCPKFLIDSKLRDEILRYHFLTNGYYRIFAERIHYGLHVFAEWLGYRMIGCRIENLRDDYGTSIKGLNK